jgi:hypothetical protein
MKRIHTIALLAILTLAALPGLTAAADSQADITISSVSVSPDTPVPGDEITIETTIQNLDDTGFFIDKVAIIEDKDNDPDTYDDILDIGTIPAGESKDVPLSTSFEEAGTYDLRVKVWGRPSDGGEQTTVQFPVTVEVVDRQPQVDIDANDTAVGVPGRGSVTVANSLGATIDDVELRIDGETVTITNEREVLASLDSGASRTIDFRYRPETVGPHELNATLYYTTAGGTTDAVSATTTVDAERRRPQVAISANDSIAGFEETGTVEVANSIGARIQNVEVTVAGEDVTVTDDRAVFTNVADGDSVTTGFTYEADEPGTHRLNATIRYSTGSGELRTVHDTVVIEADPVNDQVTLDVSSVQRADSQTLVVDVLNQGNAPLSNVTVRGSSPNATVQQTLVQHIPEGETRTVRLNTTLSEDRADVAIDVTYDVGNLQGSADAATSLSQTPGTITLTGIEVVPEQGRLRISGSASNLGTTDAQSVLVSVVGTDQVTPAEPNREFFVGAVPASDFASFDVYATTEGNVSTIPLEVSYLVDGDRRTRTVEVDASAATASLAAQDRAAEQNTGGPPLVPIAVGAVVVIAVVAIMVRAWRASRGGN